jgi:hypothetical protein
MPMIGRGGGGGGGPPGGGSITAFWATATPGVAVRDAVFMAGAGLVDKAHALPGGADAIGVVDLMFGPWCRVVTDGPIWSFGWGLTAGRRYYLSKVAGQIVVEGDPNFPTLPGERVQAMGIAGNPDRFITDVDSSSVELS